MTYLPLNVRHLLGHAEAREALALHLHHDHEPPSSRKATLAIIRQSLGNYGELGIEASGLLDGEEAPFDLADALLSRFLPELE